MKRVLNLVLLAPFLLSSCSGPKSQVVSPNQLNGEVVEARGSSPYKPEDMPGTRAAALGEAQKAAVALVVRVYVNAATRSGKTVAIDEEVLADAPKFVKRHEILSEGRSGYEHAMRIRALVDTVALSQKLKSLGLLKQASFGQPRIALLFQEYIKERPSKDRFATQALADALKEKGFKIESLPGSIDPDDSDPLEVARGMKHATAELLFAGFGRAHAVTPAKKKTEPTKYQTTISFRVIEVGTGEVLQTVTQEAQVDFEKSGAAIFETAAKQAAKDLANLSQEMMKRAHISVTISGLKSFAVLDEVEKSLASMNGIKDLYLRSYSQETGVAMLDVIADTAAPQEIADRAVKTGGADWSVYQISGRSIQLSASQAGR